MKKTLRAISLLIAMTMAFGMMSIATVSAAVVEKPAVSQVLYADGFEKETQDERITLNGKSTYDAKNGKIRMQTADGESAKTTIYLNRDQSQVGGIFAVDMTLKHDFTKPDSLNIWFGGATANGTASNRLFDLRWHGRDNVNWDNQMQIYTGSKATLSQVYDSAKITLLFNTVEGTVKLWVNDTLITTDKDGNALPEDIISAGTINRVYFYNNGNKAMDVEIQDFKFYTVPLAGRPEPKSYIYEDTFETDIATHNDVMTNSRLTISKADVTLKQESGGLVITNSASSGEGGVNVHFRKNKMPVSGKVFVDYTYTVTTDTLANVWFRDCKAQSSTSTTNNALLLNWTGKGMTNRTAGSEVDIPLETYQTDTTVRVVTIFDTKEGTYSLWVNDKLYGENLPIGSATDANRSLYNVIFYTAPGNNKTKLQNFRVGIIPEVALPDAWELKYAEDFEGNVTKSDLNTTSTSSSMTVSEPVSGALPFSASGFSRLYLNFESFTDDFIEEYTLTRETGRPADVNEATLFIGPFRVDWYDYHKDKALAISDGRSNDVYSVTWADGTNTKSYSAETLQSLSAYNALQVIGCYDNIAKTYTLYLNGKLIGTAANYDVASKSRIEFCTQANGTAGGITDTDIQLNLEEYKVYVPVNGSKLRVTGEGIIEYGSGTAGSATLLVAGYDAEDNFIGVSKSECTFDAGRLYRALPETVAGATKYKVMLWSDLNDKLQPLCPCENFAPQQ